MQNVAEQDDLARRGEEIYDRLKPMLEPEHNGKVVAIHVDTEEYAVGQTFSTASRGLIDRHRDGRVYALFIGPPTPREFQLAGRLGAEPKR